MFFFLKRVTNGNGERLDSKPSVSQCREMVLLILFWIFLIFKHGFFHVGLNNEEYQVVIGNDTTHYIIDDLEPASNYTFYIVAYMPMGASQMSDHVTQNTLEDGKRMCS